MKIAPPGMSFLDALRSGYLGRIESRQYMDWVKTLPCCGCGAPADDPHHITNAGLRGAGTKVPDFLTIPLCRPCHDSLHDEPSTWEVENGPQWQHAAMTMLQAICEGRV